MDKTTKSTMERKALSRVPENQRQSWYSIAFIWIGTMICIPMLMVGGLLSASMTFGNVLLACAIGFAICSALMIMVGMQGTDLGLPSSMCGTKAFGDRGSSYLLSVSIFIGQMGWFGIQTATCASAFVTLMNYWGISFPFWLSCLIWGCVMLVTAVYGFKLMKWLNYIAVPALIAMCVYGMFHSISVTGWNNIISIKPDPSNMLGMASAVSTVIGLFAVGATTNPDYTRYAKNRGATVMATALGVIPAAVLMFMVGAVMSLSDGTYDITSVFASMGLPVLSMLVLILATWTTNTGNAYTSGMAAMKVFNLKDERRPLVTMLCGAAGTIMAMAGMANAMQGFINVISAMVPPIMGVVIADYWVLGKGNPANWHPVRGFNWCGIIAWACGCIVALFFSFFSPALDAVIVSGIIYSILYPLCGKGVMGGQGEITLDEIEANLK